LTPKLNKVPCVLFILTFKSVGPYLKKNGTRVSKRTHCNTNLRRNNTGCIGKFLD
jgi:hypothetical protein